MNLFKFANIFKHNTKNEKTKEAAVSRIDIFLIIVLFILIATPVAVTQITRIKAEQRQINLYITPYFEELFGAEITERIISEFNENNPDIRIRLQNTQEEKNSQPPAEPDIIIYDESSLFDKTAALLPINSYLDFELDSDEDILSIPLVSFMDILFYNIDILSNAGFDRPPRTRGEYNTYSRTVADNNFYCDDFSEPENNRPLPYKLEDFVNGKAAMIVASTRNIPYLRENMGDEAFGITAVPYAMDGTVGRYDINLSGINAGISLDSEYPETAWSFIQFLSGYSSVFCEELKAVPGTISDVIPGDYVKNDPFYSKAWEIFEYNRLSNLND